MKYQLTAMHLMAILSVFNMSCKQKIATPAGKAFYFSVHGDDKNEGTIDKPRKNIAHLNLIGVQPGDTIFLKGEESFSGTITIDSSISGSENLPVVITSYGKGNAIINGGDSSAIVLYQTKNIIVKDLNLRGTGRKTGNVKDGIAILNSSHILIDNLDISGFQKSGLLIYLSANVRVNKIYTHDNGSAGITVEGNDGKKNSNNIQIVNCLAENNPGDPTNLTNHSGNGIVVGHCTNVLIDSCVATNNGWDMPRIGNGPVGIWCYEADSVTIQHCLSYKNKTSVGGADGGGFDMDGGVTNSVIQYCYSYGNQGSGYCIFQYWGASPWYNNVVRYNISEDDGTVSDSRAGIYVWNSSGDKDQFYDCLVYNNTVYNSREAALSFSEVSKRKNFKFFNNIFVGKDSLIKGDKGIDTFLANDWWSLDKKFEIDRIYDLNTWAQKNGQEMLNGKLLGLNMDPGFTDPGNSQLVNITGLKNISKYKIPANSVLRNAGLDLKKLYGIESGGVDFNKQIAPSNGIGASF